MKKAPPPPLNPENINPWCFREALETLTGIPFTADLIPEVVDGRRSVRPVLIAKRSPFADELDRLFHLHENKALRLVDGLEALTGFLRVTAQPRSGDIVILHCNPYAFALCQDDLSGPLERRLKAARGPLEDLTGVSWLDRPASLIASTVMLDGPQTSKLFAALTPLWEKRLIAIQRRTPDDVVVVDASPHLASRIAAPGAQPPVPLRKFYDYERTLVALSEQRFFAARTSRQRDGYRTLPSYPSIGQPRLFP